jgi:hypothetical protein
MPIPPEPMTSITAYFPIFCIRGSELFKPLLATSAGPELNFRAAFDSQGKIQLFRRGYGRMRTEIDRNFTMNNGNASFPYCYPLFALREAEPYPPDPFALNRAIEVEGAAVDSHPVPSSVRGPA